MRYILILLAICVSFSAKAEEKLSQEEIGKIEVVLSKFFSAMQACNDFKCMEGFYKDYASTFTLQQIHSTPVDKRDEVVQFGKLTMKDFFDHMSEYNKEIKVDTQSNVIVIYKKRDCADPCKSINSTALVKENGAWKLGSQ